MKQKILMAAVLSMFVAPVASAGDKVILEFEGNKESLDAGKLKEIEVCEFKRMLAGKYRLEVKKFEVRKAGALLRGGKTMHEEGTRPYSRLQIKKVSYSNQCR